MKKFIRMTRPVFDNLQAQTKAEAIHETSTQLTNAFFGDSHPFREILRQTVSDKYIAKRRIKLFVEGMAKYTRHPQTGKRAVIFNVSNIMLEVEMKDIELEYELNGPHQEQTRYIQGKLNEYINDQCFSVPCKGPDQIERFLHYLKTYVPCIWDHFKVKEKKLHEK